MGVGIRMYLVNEDDTLKRFPLARFQRLFQDDPEDRSHQGAGHYGGIGEGRGAR